MQAPQMPNERARTTVEMIDFPSAIQRFLLAARLAPAEAAAGGFDTLEETRIALLQAVIEPVVLAVERRQDARRTTVARNYDFFLLGQPQVSRQIIFNLREGHFFFMIFLPTAPATHQ